MDEKKSISWEEYISSSYWKKFSKDKLSDIDVKCVICGRPKFTTYKVNSGKHKKGDKRKLLTLTLHHKDYNNLGVGEDNVIPLCRAEHSLIHDIERLAQSQPFWKKVYDMICEETEWGYEKAENLEVPLDFKEKKSRK